MRPMTKATTIAASCALLGLTSLVLFAPVLPARAEVVVRISKSQQRLAVTVDGTELYRWPVSTGRRGLETPSGDFRPIRLERKWYSRKYDWSPMPYSIFFHRGYAVHGTYERRRLGSPVSHGCVRLLPDNAATLFSLVRREGKGNAQIVVMNGPLPPPADAATMAETDKPKAAPPPKHEPAPRPVTRAAEPEISVPLPEPIEPKFAVTAAPRPKPAAVPPPEPVKQAVRVPTPPPRVVKPHVAPQHVVHVRARDRDNVRTDFAPVGSDAAVLRGREAWLRSLDRKYGITR